MKDWLIRGDFGYQPTDLLALLLGLLIAFMCGHVIAWVYMWTHTGLSYSKSFVNSLVVLPTVVAIVMMVLSNNLVTAFGMMAVFAIVRFRNILRDTLDTTYVLSVIVIGMAAGTMKFATAVIGCALMACIMLYLWYTSFGSRHRYDVIINLRWNRPLPELSELGILFYRHSLKTHCASQRTLEGEEGTDLSYRLLLRDRSRMEELLMELRKLGGVSHVSGLTSEDESEI
jgi:hypothetical protein